MNLASKKCVPCRGGVSKMTKEQMAPYLAQIRDWRHGDNKIHKTYRFGDFIDAMNFVNRMAEIAEWEGHHPDFAVHYNDVEVTVWTHKAGGLTESDFILAAKIDTILGES